MQKIKELLSRETVMMLLQILGYIVNNQYQFKLRKEEKTASTTINKDGTIHDYGDGFHGNIFQILMSYHNMTFHDAVTWVKKELNFHDTSYVNTPKTDYANISLEASKYLQKIEQRCTVFTDFKSEAYKDEALQIAPIWVWEQASTDALSKIKEVTIFDHKINTLAIRIYDYNNKLISIKWRRIKGKGKWIATKGTHPNNQCLHFTSDPDAPTYIVEGHHDFLTAILLNSKKKSNSAPFNVLMVPTVNYSKFSKLEVDLLKDKDVYFLPDLDDKDIQKGIRVFEELGMQIKTTTRSVKVINLKSFLNVNNIDSKGKIDLSESVIRWSDSNTYTFVNLLHNYANSIESYNPSLVCKTSELHAGDVDQIQKYLDKHDQRDRKINKLKKMLENPHITTQQSITIRDEINKLLSEFLKVEEEAQKMDKYLLDKLDKLSLNYEDLSNRKVEFIVDSLIIKNETTMIAAPPATGKSLTANAMVNMSLEDKNVDKVIYLDLDNSPTTLQDRNIGTLIKKWDKQFQYILPIRKENNQNVTEADVWDIIKELLHFDLSNILIVFDSAKNFLQSGKDRDKNKDVSPLLKMFKKLRNQGATIIFLHHTNKPQGTFAIQYAGSSAWAEDATNAFILNRNDHKKTFVFEPIKSRVGDLKKTAYTYNGHNHRLINIDLENAVETAEEEEIRNIIIKFISSQNQNQQITYSNIMRHLRSAKHINKDKANKAIQAGKGKYWQATKIKEQNNKDVYTLIIADNTDKSDKQGD